ncbi:MAG: VWA domain-containing protein [Acidobacteriota bacterium]
MTRTRLAMVVLLIFIISLTPLTPLSLTQAVTTVSTQEEVTSEPLLRSFTDLVTVYATVRDSSGHIVSGLGPQDFELFDNQIKQKIEYFSEKDHPSSIGILLDTSISMKNKLDIAKLAVRQFIDRRQQGDQFFIITFNTNVELTYDFTYSLDGIVGSLFGLQADGLTALNDAVYLGIRKLQQGHYRRRALLLISDGENNSSKIKEDVLCYTLSEANVQLYAIGILDKGGLGKRGQQLLNKLSEISGGLTFFTPIIELNNAIDAINTDLRHQYSLGFIPTDDPAGSWHKLKLRVKGEPNINYLIRNRSGYRAVANKSY